MNPLERPAHAEGLLRSFNPSIDEDASYFRSLLAVAEKTILSATIPPPILAEYAKAKTKVVEDHLASHRIALSKRLDELREGGSEIPDDQVDENEVALLGLRDAIASVHIRLPTRLDHRKLLDEEDEEDEDEGKVSDVPLSVIQLAIHQSRAWLRRLEVKIDALVKEGIEEIDKCEEMRNELLRERAIPRVVKRDAIDWEKRWEAVVDAREAEVEMRLKAKIEEGERAMSQLLSILKMDNAGWGEICAAVEQLMKSHH